MSAHFRSRRLARLAAAATLLAGLTCASGCHSVYGTSIPVAESAEIVPFDLRPELADKRTSSGWLALNLVPFVPYVTCGERRFLERSFAKAMEERLQETNVFRVVYGPSDPHAQRQGADAVLEVTLRKLVDRPASASWILGPVGVVLWVFLLPQEWVTTEAEVSVTWRWRRDPGRLRTRAWQEPFVTEGKAKFSSLYTVYHDVESREVQRAGEAVGRALEDALRRGVRRIRTRLTKEPAADADAEEGKPSKRRKRSRDEEE